jgi:hypothetical protein
MNAFLASQILHTTVCQIKIKPLIRVLFLKGAPKESKEWIALPGTAVTNPNQAKTNVHTSTATGQVKNKWDSVSTTKGHHTQSGLAPPSRKPLTTKFRRVGNLCNTSFQAKITTFNGARLIQLSFKTRQQSLLIFKPGRKF